MVVTLGVPQEMTYGRWVFSILHNLKNKCMYSIFLTHTRVSVGNCFKVCKAECVITHLWEIIAIMQIHAHIKTNNPVCEYNNIKQFFAYYYINRVAGIPYNLTR